MKPSKEKSLEKKQYRQTPLTLTFTTVLDQVVKIIIITLDYYYTINWICIWPGWQWTQLSSKHSSIWFNRVTRSPGCTSSTIAKSISGRKWKIQIAFIPFRSTGLKCFFFFW